MHSGVVLERELWFPVTLSSEYDYIIAFVHPLFVVIGDLNDGSDGVVGHG